MNDRPSVLMVTGAYFPELSGAGLQCRAVVRQFSDTVRAAVLTTTADPALPVDDRRDNVSVHRVFVNPASSLSKLSAGIRLGRFLLRARRRFDILHLHGFSQKSVLLIVLGRLIGKRIVIKLTSVGHDDPLSMRARGPLTWWCYSQAHVFVGPSQRFQQIYEASGLPRDRFRLISNGVDLDRFRPASPDERRTIRAELDLPPEAPVVLFVGFFSPEKCPDLLFAAWSRLAATAAPASVLVLVGATRSSYYEVDHRIADGIRSRAKRLGLESRVHFVERTLEIEKYHRAADVFVLPSLREGMPNVLLEAMACGTGCIASRLEGVTDTFVDDGDSGLLVPPGDGTALEGALEDLLSQPARAQAMGARARERIERDFGLERTAQRYVSVYRDLVRS